MEAINNMASAAAKAVWGESNTKENENPATTAGTTTTTTMNNETHAKEPISGKQGDVSKGEPFDAGNIEPATETTKDTTTTATGEAIESKGPTADKPSTTGDTHFKAAQADIRDPETSATANPKTETERKNVDDSGAGLDESDNPAKIDGPGPKPIDEVAAERSGDAGKVEGASSAPKPDAVAGAAEGEEEDNNKSKGSGEQYVKSSGLAADGGDFDATKPGAGREADRLLEEKGIANPAVAAVAGKKEENTTTSTPDSPEEGKEKKSLKEKIKAKLHKN